MSQTQNSILNAIRWVEHRIRRKQLIVLMSFLVGVFTAFAALVLKTLIELIQSLLTHGFDITHINWLYLVYPAIGVLLSALFIRFLVRDDIGHGVTKILFAISRRQGRIKPHNCWSSVIASSITIGFGGSVGAESPIVLTGSAIGSSLGKLFRVDQKTLMLLIGCGAAGAIAGIFKAPFAGLLFTLEVLMLDLTMAHLVPLLVSCVTASIITFAISGFDSMFVCDNVEPFRIVYVWPVIMLGIGCGLISLYFTKVTNAIESLFRHLGNGLWTKWIIGGIVLSILVFLFPSLYGEGYNSINTLLNGNPDDLLNNSPFYGSRMLLLILGCIVLLKAVASTVTTSAGGCGGLFAPSLFLGCISGFLFAGLWNMWGIITPMPSTVSCLLGMAAVMAGVMHAPLTSIFLIAEITGGYDLLVPLMLVTVISYITVHIFERHSIYSMRLAQRGQLVTHHKDQAILTLMSLNSVIDKYCMKIAPDMTLGNLVMLIAKEKENVFPVVDGAGNLRGILNIRNIRKVIFRQELYGAFTAEQLMEPAPDILSINSPMTYVMDSFDRLETDVLPVVDENGLFVGLIHKTALFEAYRQTLVDFSEE
ncbi:MAG: chloride channel protein [Bacteroidaceae bacterium]|nr:chloride channel protein [Bacteroidaceae bacterium]